MSADFPKPMSEELHEVRHLVTMLCDDELTDAQAYRLEELVSENKEACWYYVKTMHLHAALPRFVDSELVVDLPTLAHDFRNELSSAESSNVDMTRATRPTTATPYLSQLGTAVHETLGYFANPARFSVLVSLATLATVLALFAMTSVPRPNLREQPLAQNVPVARLVRVFDGTWVDSSEVLREGNSLLPGAKIALAAGLAEVAFDDGARVILEGPAEFIVDDAARGTLQHGRLSARVPKMAVGFAVQSPHAKVIDLGTEFGMCVAETGHTTVRVFDGRVRVETLVNSESNEKPSTQEMIAGQGLSIAVSGTVSVEESQGDDRFVRRMPPVAAKDLDAFAKTVLQSHPIAYWRPTPGLKMGAIDVTGNEHHARVGRGKADGTNVCRYLFAADHPQLTGHAANGSGLKQLTLEARFRVDGLNGAAVLVRKYANHNLADPGYQMDNGYWLSLSGLDNRDGTVMFHLGDELGRPVEVISAPGTIVPGRWYHVVGTWDGQQATLYINGQRQATANYQSTLSDTAGHVGLGAIVRNNDGSNIGQVLQGQLEDVCIYDRALRPEQIETHYRDAKSAKPEASSNP